MQLRNSLTGLVVTPNQFERADSILRSISSRLSVSSRTGSRLPPPANAEMSLPSFNSFLNDLLLQPLPEQQQEETATEASISSPEVTSDAAPVPKRRKRQLTEAEVKEKLLSGLQSPSSSPALRNENLFDRSVDFGQVCRRILQLEREQNLGLIDQVFYIGGMVVEVLQHQLATKNCARIASELQKFGVFLGKTKVAEAKRIYELCKKFPKLRPVRTGFSPMELTQSVRHFENICSSDRDFWSQE